MSINLKIDLADNPGNCFGLYVRICCMSCILFPGRYVAQYTIVICSMISSTIYKCDSSDIYCLTYWINTSINWHMYVEGTTSFLVIFKRTMITGHIYLKFKAFMYNLRTVQTSHRDPILPQFHIYNWLQMYISTLFINRSI